MIAPFVLVAVAFPPALYFYGLSLVPMPAKLVNVAPLSDQECAWAEVEGSNDLLVRSMTPWTPFHQMFTDDALTVRWPGANAAGLAAQDYVISQRHRMSNLKWHISTGALAVWFTRHASAADLATRVAPIVSETPRTRRRTSCNLTPNPSLQRTTPGHSPGCCR
jgi:hypothetical protein